MNENDFLKSFAKVLGAETKFEELEEKRLKEKRMLESLGARFGVDLTQEAAKPVPVTLLQQPPVLTIVEEKVEEILEAIEENVIPIMPQLPVATMVTKSVEMIAKAAPADVQKTVDSISGSLRQEIDSLKKSVTDLHRFARNTSQMGGGGEVNLRYLDDIARDTIGDNKFLRYVASTKKFEFYDFVNGINLPNANVSLSSEITSETIGRLVLGAVDTSNTSTLPAGTYGNASDVPAPWSAYQFSTTPPIVITVGDIVAGAAIPINSYVVALGTNNYVIANTAIPGVLPVVGQDISVVTFVNNAVTSLTTQANTDILLNPTGTGRVVANSSIHPLVDGAYSLGTPARRWQEIWLGSGTVYIKDSTLNVDLGLGANNGNFIIQGAAGLEVGEFVFRDNTLKIKDKTRDIVVGQSDATGYWQLNRPMKVVSGITGQTTFDVSREGFVTINSPTVAAGGHGLNIVGSIDGSYSTIGLAGRMIHVTGNDGVPSRVENDAYGTGAFAGYLGRSARGTAAIPTATQSGDTFARFGALGYGNTGWLATNVNSGPPLNTIDFVASQNYTDTNAGSQIDFYTSPNNARTRTLSATINTFGLTTNSATFANNVYIGNVGNTTNLHISGGANDAILVCDGANNLVWTPRHLDGSWTPVMIPATGSNVVFTVTTATYVKNGPIVNMFFDITVNSMGTAAGALRFDGFPFISKSGGNYVGAVAIQYYANLNVADAISITGSVLAGNNRSDMWFTKLNGQSVVFSTLVATDLKVGTHLIGSVVYGTDF